MNKLALLFHSKVRAEVLRLLFGVRSESMYRAEIIAHTKFAKRSVEEELDKLVGLELLDTSKDGNRRYYAANKVHPLYPDLQNIVLKTVGLGDVLKAALVSEKIEFAFVFGSLAALSENAQSDVDLMIIGRLGHRELTPLLRGLADKIGREINPHIFDWDEFARRVKERDHFLGDVLAKPKLFIIGNEHEFTNMARERLAAAAPDRRRGNPKPLAAR
jgi:DNA-binding transcriptional ArsR family regulator